MDLPRNGKFSLQLHVVRKSFLDFRALTGIQRPIEISENLVRVHRPEPSSTGQNLQCLSKRGVIEHHPPRGEKIPQFGAVLLVSRESFFGFRCLPCDDRCRAEWFVRGSRSLVCTSLTISLNTGW